MKLGEKHRLKRKKTAKKFTIAMNSVLWGDA